MYINYKSKYAGHIKKCFLSSIQLELHISQVDEHNQYLSVSLGYYEWAIHTPLMDKKKNLNFLFLMPVTYNSVPDNTFN